MHRYFTHFAKISWFTLIVICLNAVTAFSQETSFINPVSAQDLPGSPEMEEYKLRLRNNPNVAAFHFVRLNHLRTAQKDGLLTLKIPGQARPIIAEVSHVEYHDERNYEWIGNTDEGRGTVVLISKSGRVSAHISTPGGVYEIFPAPNGLYSLREIDSAKAGDVGCETTSDERSERTMAEISQLLQESPKTDGNAKMNACLPLVNPRVLVLYTPKALGLQVVLLP